MRKLLILLALALIFCACASAELIIEPVSGFYDGDIIVTITASGGGKIYYSLDGTLDDPIEYTGEIKLKKAGDYQSYTVKAWTQTGEAASEGYIIGDDCVERFDLPVAIVQTADYNLYDYEFGIFEKGKVWDDYDSKNPDNNKSKSHHPANYNRRGDEWMRFSTLTILSADGEKILSQSAAMGVSGAASASNEVQKSLRFDADEDYDAAHDSFVSDLIDDVAADGSRTPTLDKYKSIILRNSGNDFIATMIRWNFISEMFRRAGENTVTAASPCVVFLNGSYYGLAQFQPRLSDRFIAESIGLADRDQVEKYKGGSRTFFTNDALSYIDSGDFSTPESIDALDETLDVASCIRYIAFEIFCDNGDWNGNTLIWRYNGEYQPSVPESDGRWRFIPFDLDFAFGLYSDRDDTFDLAMNVAGTSPILRFAGKLLENDRCVDLFMANLYEISGEIFTDSAITEVIGAADALVATELTEKTPIAEVRRYDHTGRVSELTENAKARRGVLYDKLELYYGFAGRHIMAFSDCGDEANIYVNGVMLNGEISGEWFDDVTAVVTCEAHPGYEFSHWIVNGTEYADAELTITDEMRGRGDVSVTAVCAQLPQALVIEAVAVQGDNDYVIIRNAGSEDYVLRGVWLSDNGENLLKQPLDGILGPGEELLIAENAFVGALTFGLKNGEMLYLTDANGIIDSVYIRKMGSDQEYRRVNGGGFGFFERQY